MGEINDRAKHGPAQWSAATRGDAVSPRPAVHEGSARVREEHASPNRLSPCNRTRADDSWEKRDLQPLQAGVLSRRWAHSFSPLLSSQPPWTPGTEQHMARGALLRGQHSNRRRSLFSWSRGPHWADWHAFPDGGDTGWRGHRGCRGQRQQRGRRDAGDAGVLAGSFLSTPSPAFIACAFCRGP